MEKDTVEVVLNPVARFVPGANGAVDLYMAPAYDDIASLYLEGDHWVLHFANVSLSVSPLYEKLTTNGTAYSSR
jgi:hypothetical protein